MMEKQRHFSHTSWEKVFGYCRAIRSGNFIEVSGTTAVDDAGEVVCEGDYYGQSRYALQKIEKAIQALQGQKSDIVRTRIFIRDIAQWEHVARAHSEFFGTQVPVASLIEIPKLIDSRLLIEIEASAILSF